MNHVNNPRSTARATCNGWNGHVMNYRGYRMFRMDNGIAFRVIEKGSKKYPADKIVELATI